MKMFLILTLMSISVPALSNIKGEDLLRKFDLISYHPEQKGLKDVQVDISSPSITQQLKEQLIFGKLKSVSFRLYWSYPDKIDVQVIGLPDGFHEIKDGLRRMIATRIDFIIPKLMEKKFTDYQLKTTQENNKTTLTATDVSAAKLITKYELRFNRKNEIEEIMAMHPVGKQVSTISGGVKSWSNNKWVLDVIKVKSTEKGAMTETIHLVEYEKVAGYGVPKVLKTKTIQKVVLPDGVKINENKIDPKSLERQHISVLYFKDYKLNSGNAKKWFIKNHTLNKAK